MMVAVDCLATLGAALDQDTTTLAKERTMTGRGQRPVQGAWDPGPSTMARVGGCQRGVASGDRIPSKRTGIGCNKLSASLLLVAGGAR